MAKKESTFLGQPAELFYLTAINMWETFSYFGTRALLILYFTRELAMGQQQALGHYAAFTALVFATTIFGGMIGDRFFTKLETIAIGCGLVLLGHLGLAAEDWSSQLYGRSDISAQIMFLSLALLATGVGVMKPSVFTSVGLLYKDQEAQRESGFLIFYWGVGLSAPVAILGCGYLASRFGYHVGFGFAGLGMLVGMIILAFTYSRLAHRLRDSAAQPRTAGERAGGVAAIAILTLAAWLGIWQVAGVGAVLSLLVLGSVAYILYYGLRHLQQGERAALFAVIPITLAGMLFHVLLEQTGGSLSLFADRHVDLSLFGLDFHASQTQSITPMFVLVFAPLLAWLWGRMARNGKNPSAETKISLGFLVMGAAFLILLLSHATASDEPISLWLLLLSYLLIAVAELMVVPIGSARVTKLAPPQISGVVFGFWVIGLSCGNYLAAWGAGLAVSPDSEDGVNFLLLLGVLTGLALISGLLLLTGRRPLARIAG